MKLAITKLVLGGFALIMMIGALATSSPVAAAPLTSTAVSVRWYGAYSTGSGWHHHHRWHHHHHSGVYIHL